jgi:Zn-dependent M16 (insulinase) family peptidase
MEALRELNLDKIKEYHREYYNPHNLCLVVTGRLSTQALLEEIEKTVEARATLHGQNLGVKPEGWKRPFVETDSATIPEFKEDASLDVEFPAKEENSGRISIIMRGPSQEDTLTLGVRPGFHCLLDKQ